MLEDYGTVTRGVIPLVPGSYSPQVLCSPLCMRRGNIGPFYYFYYFWDLYSPLFPKRVLCSPFCMSRGKGSYVPLWNPGNIGPGEHRTLFIGLKKGPMFPSQQVWPVWQIQFISIPTFPGFYIPVCSVTGEQRVLCSPVCSTTGEHRTPLSKNRELGHIEENGSLAQY